MYSIMFINNFFLIAGTAGETKMKWPVAIGLKGRRSPLPGIKTGNFVLGTVHTLTFFFFFK